MYLSTVEWANNWPFVHPPSVGRCLNTRMRLTVRLSLERNRPIASFALTLTAVA